MLYGDGGANDGAGWAVIGTMMAVLITFLRLVFKKSDGAVEQWKLIAATLANEKKALEIELETMLGRERTSIAEIARLKAENRHLKSKGTLPPPHTPEEGKPS